MLGFFDDHSKVHLILELASHGDIYKEIKKEVNFILNYLQIFFFICNNVVNFVWNLAIKEIHWGEGCKLYSIDLRRADIFAQLGDYPQRYQARKYSEQLWRVEIEWFWLVDLHWRKENDFLWDTWLCLTGSCLGERLWLQSWYLEHRCAHLWISHR